MMNYEVTGTPSQVVENVQSIFSVTKAEAELIVMSLLYNQDEEVVDEVAVRNFIGSLDQEKASAVIRGVPLTIQITGILPDIVKKCVQKLIKYSAIQIVTGSLSLENVKKATVIAEVLGAVFDVMQQHTTWLGKELIQRDSFVALMDYTGCQVAKGIQSSIYDIQFTLEDIQKWMQDEIPENPDAGKGLEKDFKLFEEKKLIKKRAETIGNDGVKQVIYQIVF